MPRSFSVLLVLAALSLAPRVEPTPPSVAPVPTTTLYLPNITKMLGGADGWQTPFVVQNIGTADADLAIDFYGFGDGPLVKTRRVSGLRPGASLVHDPNADQDLAVGGQFSVVIRSFGSEVVAIVNQHRGLRDPARQEAFSYIGLSGGSTRVFLPSVANGAGGWLTTFIVQNLGSATATVSASFQSLDGARRATLARTIAPGRSQHVDPRLEPALTPGLEYAVSLSADQPIGAVVNAHNDASDAPRPMGFSYNGVPATSASSTFLPHLARNADGRTSRVVIQNAGLAPATPTLRFRRLGQDTAAIVEAPAPLPPGASWSFDPRQAPQLADGEFSLRVAGGQFAALATTLSATSAMGYTAQSPETTLYLPNVTRALGGASGWTTPIVLQSTGARSATLRWRRVADGALVHVLPLLGLEAGAGLRIDPRRVDPLSDDTQYAVVIEAAAGGVAAIVTELGGGGGDAEMVYEGIAPPLGNGGSGCRPASAPAGATFTCRFVGLPPGSPVSFTVAGEESSSTQAAADGSTIAAIRAEAVGAHTVRAAAGGVSKAATFAVTPAAFAARIATSRYGHLAVVTAPGAACAARARLPSGSYSQAEELLAVKEADAAGNVSWSYRTSVGTQAGSGTHAVSCTAGSQTLKATAEFRVP